jgi:HAMP domain-containing protein
MSILLTALVTGMVSILLLFQGTRNMERQNLDSALETARNLLTQRLDTLRQGQTAVSALVARGAASADDLETLASVHHVLSTFNIARVETFRGLQPELDVFRWQRGAHPDLATVWLPPHPRIAAEVTAGQSVLWIQRGSAGSDSLKLLAPIPSLPGTQKGWVVVTEPLDSVFLRTVLPDGLSGVLEVDQRLVGPYGSEARKANGGLAPPLSVPQGRVTRFGGIPPERRVLLTADDGLRLGLLAAPAVNRTLPVLFSGVRAWLLITALGALIAVVLGSGIAARLLGPLRILLEGTAAMARGHLTVRLPAMRGDELGALTREFNRMADEIRNTYLGLISTLAEVVEAKSQYTREHIERVEHLTMRTAEVLERRGWVRFSSHQRFLLSVAAILHDVGKIAISNEILNKSGPLNEGERHQILTHPEVGALIVERMGKLDRAAEIIRHAHEHFDGSGYPRGLKGEEIPLGSRIILAVDAFDAMTVDRPYSVGRPLQEAIAELRSEAGNQFDPVVVEALIEAATLDHQDSDSVRSSDSGLVRILYGGQTPTVNDPRPRAPRE